MARMHLADRQWAFIQPFLLPLARSGGQRRRQANHRGQSLDAHRRLSVAGPAAGVRCANDRVATAQTLGRGGVWERIRRAALSALDQQGKLDWSMAFLDGSFATVKKGGEQVGLTKQGKATTWMLVVD